MGKGFLVDEELITMIKNGGEERLSALTQIYKAPGLQDRVANYVSYHGGAKKDGVDVFVESVLILDRNIRNDKFRGDSLISTYVYGIAKLYWVNKSRIVKHKIVGVDEIPTEFSDYQNPELIFITEEMKEKLDNILNLLSEKCGKILRLWSNNAKYKEIAIELGVDNSTQLRKMKYDCQRKLKEGLLQRPELIPTYYNDK